MKKQKNIKSNLKTQPANIKNNINIFKKVNSINKNTFAVFAISLFALVVGIGMHFHEMWRDELEIYITKKYIGILMEGDLSYVVYYLLIKLFLLISPTLGMYQFFHYLVIVSAVSILLFYCPLNNIEKLLFSFSYFVFYEYGIISRYYGFLLLLLFLIIFLISRPRRNYLIITILILILADHSVSSAFFAISISLYLILDIYNKLNTKRFTFKKNYNIILATIFFFVGWAFVFAIHYMVTLKNSSYMEGGFGSSPIFLTIKNIWNSYVPIPDLKVTAAFWNTNIIPFTMLFPSKYDISDYYTFGNIFAFIISLAILFISICKFSRKPLVLITFLINLLLYFIFMQYLKVYFLRYQGLFFIIFFYCYWLYSISDKKELTKHLDKISNFFDKKIFNLFNNLFKTMLYIILTAQVFSSFYALSKDIKYKFTFSQDAAEYIKQKNLQNTHIMVGYIDYVAQSISAYTGKKIFFPQHDDFEYYQKDFSKTRKKIVEFSVIINACINFTEKQNKKVLLILNFPIIDNNNQLISKGMFSQKSSVELLQAFSGEEIQPDEQFWLYEVKNISN